MHFVHIVVFLPSVIRLKTFISVDGGVTWEDANEVPGPLVLNASAVRLKYVVNNTGPVSLFNVSLTSTAGDLPALGRDLGQLLPLQVVEVITTPAFGSELDSLEVVGTATGHAIGLRNEMINSTSSDPIHCYGISASMCLHTYHACK